MKFNGLKITVFLVAYLLLGSSQEEATAQDCPPDALPANGIVYTLWNGFLDMSNVLEIINRGDAANSVTVEFFDINGELKHTETRFLNANEQNDIVLNEISAFEQDSYGVVKLTYTGEIDGRVTYYRGDITFSNFEFAYAIPFTNPLQGRSAVSFNTFQPSLAPEDANKLVANWLSVLNLSPSTQSYVVSKYDINGALLSENSISVPSFARVDVEAGHVNPGPNTVGLMIIQPTDNTHEYIGHLTRFGYDSPLPIPELGFTFATTLVAKCPDQGERYAIITSRFSWQGWLELVNTGGNFNSYSFKVYSNVSELILDTTITLPPYSQVHTDITDLFSFKPVEIGIVKIEPIHPSGQFVAQVATYFREFTLGQLGELKTMFITQARQASLGAIKGSYNLFLGMINDYYAANLSKEEALIFQGSATNSTPPFSDVPPFSMDILSDESARIENDLLPDTFGVFIQSSISSTSPGKLPLPIIAEAYRTHGLNPVAGDIDFIIPIIFR